MSAKEAKPKETWDDWFPPGMPEPPGLMTRDELINRLRDAGLNVTTSKLRFWEQKDVLPRPIRRRHEGATRALYPPWEVAFIVAVKEMTQDGLTLEQTKVGIREIWTQALAPNPDSGEPGSPDRFAGFLEFFLLAPHLKRFVHVHRALGGPLLHHLVLAGYSETEGDSPVVTLDSRFAIQKLV
jgi:hypothetical protein